MSDKQKLIEQVQNAARVMEFFTNICSKAVDLQISLAESHAKSIKLIEESVRKFDDAVLELERFKETEDIP